MRFAMLPRTEKNKSRKLPQLISKQDDIKTHEEYRMSDVDLRMSQIKSTSGRFQALNQLFTARENEYTGK